jgi:hypothetical protein
MSLMNLDRLVATQGSFIVNNTTAKTTSFVGLLVLEDTVFSALRVDGTDVKSTYIAATGTAVKAGALITGQGVKFSGVTLTSGSVALILG